MYQQIARTTKSKVTIRRRSQSILTRTFKFVLTAAFWELVTVVLAVWLTVTDVVHGHTLGVVAPELGLSAFSGFYKEKTD